MSPNDTFGRILFVLTFADSMMASSLSFPFDIVVEVVLSPFGSAVTEDVECLFDLVLVAARILCSRDDLKRLNVLSWMSGLTEGSEVLGGVDVELPLGLGSRVMLKGLEIASCARRCRTADVMYFEHPEGGKDGEGRGLQCQRDGGGE